jgi:hypothetical protein
VPSRSRLASRWGPGSRRGCRSSHSSRPSGSWPTLTMRRGPEYSRGSSFRYVNSFFSRRLFSSTARKVSRRLSRQGQHPSCVRLLVCRRRVHQPLLAPGPDRLGDAQTPPIVIARQRRWCHGARKHNAPSDEGVSEGAVGARFRAVPLKQAYTENICRGSRFFLVAESISPALFHFFSCCCLAAVGFVVRRRVSTRRV